jgi:hypothetical protein
VFQQIKTVLTVATTNQVNYIAPSLMRQFVLSIGAPSGLQQKKIKIPNK